MCAIFKSWLITSFCPCFGVCCRGTLQEHSSSVCTNDFMGILHPRGQNFHPTKCSTIFNWLNIWEQAPGANWANLKTLPRSKTPRVYRSQLLLAQKIYLFSKYVLLWSMTDLFSPVLQQYQASWADRMIPLVLSESHPADYKLCQTLRKQ